jgi:hypothetical protein
VPIASCLAYVKGLLVSLPMPGSVPDMAAYINAPDPNTETDIPTSYVWPTEISEARDLKNGGSMSRNQGPDTSAGFKVLRHSIDVFIIHMEADDEEDADSLFPGIVDAAMKAFRFAYPMPADVIDPWTGEETQISNLGEVMRGKIFVAALEDQAYLRYDSLLRLLVTETIQA